MKAKKEDSKKSAAYYSLDNIQQLIDQGRYIIRTNALSSAIRDFGWDAYDIEDAMKKLQPKHFDKFDNHHEKPEIILDVYKARGIKGENIYTHFYINSDGLLIISSFKRI